MRTTLDVDQDVLDAVKALARQKKYSRGRIISDLARNGLAQLAACSGESEPKAFFGFRPLPHRGGVVTNELINRLRDCGFD